MGNTKKASGQIKLQVGKQSGEESSGGSHNADKQRTIPT